MIPVTGTRQLLDHEALYLPTHPLSNSPIHTGKQLLEVASKIDPGFSKLRGDLLFELQSASVLLAQRALAEDRVTPFQV